MNNSNTFKVIDKHFSREEEENVNVNAIDCIICKSAVIAEYNTVLEEVMLYDFDPYYLSRQKVLHKHPADKRTVNRILERIQVERRLLDDVDHGDFQYRRDNSNAR
jgi:hypothetical protein